MPSLPASQPGEDSEADGATAPPTDDLSSEEPHARSGGARKSVGSPTIGLEPNVFQISESIDLSDLVPCSELVL